MNKKRKNSRAKGQRGELEFASELRKLFGISARRGVQFRGGADSPDIISDFDTLDSFLNHVKQIAFSELCESEKPRNLINSSTFFSGLPS